MTHVTCRLTAKNRDQHRNPTLGNRVWAIPLPFTPACLTHGHSHSTYRPRYVRGVQEITLEFTFIVFKKRLGHCTGEIANSESSVSTVRSMSHVRFIARDFVAPERDFIAQSRIEEHTVLFRNQRVARPRNTGASP